MTEPLSAEEVRSLRSEAESERDHPNKRHATWQQLVLRLLATVDREAEARRDLEQRLAGELFKGRIALEDRYHDLAWCNKDDDCATKAEGIRLAVEDFEEAMGLAPFTHPEPSRGSALREHRRAVVHAEAALAPHDATATPGEET